MEFLLGGDENVLKFIVVWLQKSVNVLEAIEVISLNQCIVLYVNSIPLKLLPRSKKERKKEREREKERKKERKKKRERERKKERKRKRERKKERKRGRKEARKEGREEGGGRKS